MESNIVLSNSEKYFTKTGAVILPPGLLDSGDIDIRDIGMLYFMLSTHADRERFTIEKAHLSLGISKTTIEKILDNLINASILKKHRIIMQDGKLGSMVWEIDLAACAG